MKDGPRNVRRRAAQDGLMDSVRENEGMLGIKPVGHLIGYGEASKSHRRSRGLIPDSEIDTRRDETRAVHPSG